MADVKEEVVGSGSAPPEQTDRGWCLCLSGGGFRATLFHVGVIRRLNELGVLARLSTITSVSGGSILNGVLATRWSRLRFDPAAGVFTNIEEEVARPIRDFCSQDLRTKVLVGARLNPANLGMLIRDWFSVSANVLAEGYEPLFGGCRLSAPRARFPGAPLRFLLDQRPHRGVLALPQRPPCPHGRLLRGLLRRLLRAGKPCRGRVVGIPTRL